MIIDSTYFTGPLAIPQISQPAVADTIDQYVALYEPVVLSKALGESLAQALNEAIDSLGSDEELEDRFKVLIEGTTFTGRNGNKYKLAGLAPVNTTGIIASFVFFQYVRDCAHQTGGIGTVVAQAENAAVITPGHKLSTVWNGMVKNVNILLEYLLTNISTYPELNIQEIEASYFGTINFFGI